MPQTQTIDEVISKKINRSLLYFMKLVDPERKYKFDNPLIDAWYKLSLTEQRRLYLYLLYRKWQGDEIYNSPYEIILYCKPYPTNWNGRNGVNRLIKSTTKMVIAQFNGSFGTYTLDEAKVWGMTVKQLLN